VFASACESDVPPEVIRRLRNDKGHYCEMRHPLTSWAALGKDRAGLAARALQGVHLIRGGLWTHGCGDREGDRQCLGGFALTRGEQSSHDLSMCQKPPHN